MPPLPPLGPDSHPDRYQPVRLLSTAAESVLLLAERHEDGRTDTVLVRVTRAVDSVDDADGGPADVPGEGPWAVAAFRERFTGAWQPVGSAEEEKPQRALFLVAEHADGVGLRAWRDAHGDDPNLGWWAVPTVLEPVAAALDAMHSGQAHAQGLPVVHGAPSPGSVVVGPWAGAVLVDFGLGTGRDSALPPGPWLTAGYVAPEVAQAGYSPASDRYAFGATCYFALSGEEPPGAPAELRERFAELPVMAGTVPAEHEWLLRIFADDPAERPPAAQWLAALSGAPAVAAARTAGGGAGSGAAAADSPAGPGSGAPADDARRARPRPKRSRSILPAVLAVAVVLGLIAAIVYGYGAYSGGSSPGANDGAPKKPAPSPTAEPVVGNVEDGVVQDDGSVVVGDPKADLPVVEVYVDYQSPASKQFMDVNADTLADLAADGDAVVHYRPVSSYTQQPAPLSVNSLRAAAAARAAADEGRFVEYTKVLFAHQPAEGAEGFAAADLASWGEKEADLTGAAFAERVEDEGEVADSYADYLQELLREGTDGLGQERLQTMPIGELAEWGEKHGVDGAFLDDTYVKEVLDATTAVSERYGQDDPATAFPGAPAVYVNGALQGDGIYGVETLTEAVTSAGPGKLTD